MFGGSGLSVWLMVGSGLLAIALLILAVTRWGHSRPVWKCVLLSVVAHLLLIGYTCSLDLLEPRVAKKPDPPSQPMRINFNESLASTPEPKPAGQEVSPTPSAPVAWDEFATPLPRLSAGVMAGQQLERPNVDSEIEFRQRESSAFTKTVPAASSTPIPEHKTANLDVPRPTAIPSAIPLEQSVTAAQIRPRSNATAKREHAATVRSAAPKLPMPQQHAARPKPSAMPTMRLDAFENSFEPQAFASATDDAISESDAIQGQFRPAAAKPPASDLGDRTPKLPPVSASPTVKHVEGSFEPTATSPPPVREVATPQRIPRRIASGQPMPAAYALRVSPHRDDELLRRGGSKETEAAVQAALRWLADRQSLDGRWNPRKLGGGREDRVLGHDREGAGQQSDCGVTALSILAFLANGHTHMEGSYQRVVENGLEYLCSQQADDGSLSGNAKLFARMYCHSMALLAISEAYAMTGDRRLVVTVQRGVNYSVDAQNRQGGGWRYQPGDDGDMSQFGWKVLALNSAETAGIDIALSTRQGMIKFLDRCCSGRADGIASYRPGQGPSTTMTAEALVCRNMLKLPLTPATVDEAWSRIGRELPSPDDENLYYWYYGTLAAYVSGGEAWEQWNNAMKRTLLSLQVQDGPDQGSWAPTGLWAGYGGRVYSTAMAALTLEVYYRYLPVYNVANQGRQLR